MSNLEPEPTENHCGGTAGVAAGPTHELLVGRDVVLGGTRGLPVVRTLPNRHRRMVGAWCFVDAYRGDVAMRVPPHPHTALQTVTWLVTGEARHRDSIGSDQVIRPGQLNLMTAGHGISHAEQSPAGGGPLQGVQLWVALPSAAIDGAPAFAHHADLPEWTDRGITTRLIMGEAGGVRSPAHAFTPLFGAEVGFAGPGTTELPLRPDFEYAALTLNGSVTVDGQPLAGGPLLYLGTGRDRVSLAADDPALVLVLGGEPFEEHIVMWWNFIGRSHDEVVQARTDWMAGQRFGTVDFDGDPCPAPELPATTLKPRGRTR